MTNEEELKIIKKLYGEKMSHLCRNLFPKILEYPGRLCELLPKLFNPSKFLFDDIVSLNKEISFQEFVLSKYYDLYSPDGLKKNNVEEEIEDPFTLLSKAGYDLYECKTESDIQSFKKYYKKGEELCTFRGERLDRCHVFFAVKKNVDKIRREDFKNPRRQDEYGTSVISIQFIRGSNNFISIKNRYNHTVPNCDATFSNDLENIIAGLTESFEKYYNFNLQYAKSNRFELPGYVLASDGKFYKYNYEINDIYYCPDNIIIENRRVNNDFLEKEKYIVLDYFILDLQNKKIMFYDLCLEDSFIDGLKDIEKIDVINNKEDNTKTIKLILKDGNIATIKINAYNKIIGYENESIKIIGDSFLIYNSVLENIKLPNVEKIGCEFLFRNYLLKEIDLPNVEEISHEFLRRNRILEKINIPKVKKIGNKFLYNNETLKELDLPNVEEIGHDFISSNTIFKQIYIPKVKTIGNEFLSSNIALKELDLPSVEEIGNRFLLWNSAIEQLNIPKVKTIGNEFLSSNIALKELDLPSVEEIGNEFISENEVIKKINIPKIKKIGANFLFNLRKSNIKQFENQVIKKVIKSKIKNLLDVIKEKIYNRSREL